MLFENTIKVSSVARIEINICQNLRIFHCPVMVTLFQLDLLFPFKIHSKAFIGDESVGKNSDAQMTVYGKVCL